MILLGKNIVQPGDTLTEVGVDRLVAAIRNADGPVARLQEKLRIIKSMDGNQYRKMKTSLPYFVCAEFSPRIRRRENFVYTRRFLVDIDHVSALDMDIGALAVRLRADPAVELLFTSPGGDGLKVMFTIADKITDSAYYSVFYRAFCIRFAETYGLGASVDLKTCDVTRCCFVGFDPDAYHNPRAEAVNCADHVDAADVNGFDKVRPEIREAEKLQTQSRKEDVPTGEGLDPSVLQAIRERMGYRQPRRREKDHAQPEELKEEVARAAEAVTAVGLELDGNRPISYGRQLTVRSGRQWAEINIFYGKRGVSVVGTTKTGSNRELCDLVVELLRNSLENG